MVSLKELVDFEKEQQKADPVYDCLNVIKGWPESSNRKLLFYFVGKVKNLKIKLKI